MAIIGYELQDWYTKLMDAGLVPTDARRIIIDIPVDGAVRILYECYGDKEVFAVDLLAELIKPTSPVPIPPS